MTHKPQRDSHHASQRTTTSRYASHRATISAVLVFAVAGVLSGCTYKSEESPTGNNAIASTIDALSTNDDIAKTVPEPIKSRGTLIVGTSADYAPAEFVGSDGKTLEGFEIDLTRALARVMGLDADIRNSTFDSIIPSVGTKFDAGISAFTINKERMKQVNMVSLYDSGRAFGVAKGNPKNVDPEHLCGHSVAVQTGSLHEEVVTEEASHCGSGEKLTIQSYKNQTDASTAVVGRKADVMVADSPIVSYAVNQSQRRLDTVGTIVNRAPKAAIVAQNNRPLAEAIRAATQELIDNGTMKTIMDAWANKGSDIPEAQINPPVSS